MSIKIREKKLSTGEKSLFVDIYYYGQRKTKVTGVRYRLKKEKADAYRLAEEIGKKHETMLISSEYDLTDYFNHDNDNFLDYFKQNVKSEVQRSLYEHFLKFCKNKDIVPMKSLTNSLVQSFEEFLLRERNIKNTTYNLYMSNFKTICNRAYVDKKIKHKIMIHKLKSDATDREYLTMSELAQIAQFKTNTDRQEIVLKMFVLSAYTGLRYSDVVALQYEDIKKIDGKLFIIKKMKKTDKIIKVPLHGSLETYYDKTKTGLIFRNHLSKMRINQVLQHACTSCLINKKISFHVARHTFATQLLSKSKNIYAVSNLLGHTDIKTTAIYAKLIDADLSDEINKLESL